MSYFNRRGIFLQKLGPTVVDPDEVLVSMQFALKPAQDEEGAITEKLLIPPFSLHPLLTVANLSVLATPKIDGDGDIDNDDRARLLALAKAYANIVRP
jgi:hypothetical protein